MKTWKINAEHGFIYIYTYGGDYADGKWYVATLVDVTGQSHVPVSRSGPFDSAEAAQRVGQRQADAYAAIIGAPVPVAE